MENLKIKINYWANKISNLKYLVIIRDSFASLMPLMILAAMFVFVNNVILNTGEGGLLHFFNIGDNDFINYLREIGNNISRATISITTLFIAAAIPYNLAKHEKEKDLILPVIIGLASVFLFIPGTFNVVDGDIVINTGNFIDKNYLGAAGLFTAVAVTIPTIKLYIKLKNIDKLRIKMPDSVPPAVGNAFSGLLPSAITLILVSAIAQLLFSVFGTSLQDIVFKIIQMPLVGSVSTFPGFLVMFLLVSVPSLIGIHGDLALSSIITPIMTTMMVANTEALQAGKDIPYILNGVFRNTWMQSTNYLALIIVIFLFSKRKDYKMVAKTATIPAFFNISEPLLFGLPIVFNPILGIPYVLAPVVNMCIGYLLTTIHWVSPAAIEVPWTTPPLLMGYLSTGGDIRAVIFGVLCIFVSCCIYFPFVKISDNLVVNSENTNAIEDKLETAIDDKLRQKVSKNSKTLKVLVMCNAAMSSSLFAKKIQLKCNEIGLNVSTAAISLSEFESTWKDYDILMVTPQASFKKDYIDGVVNDDKPIYYIDMEQFGKMDVTSSMEFIDKYI